MKELKVTFDKSIMEPSVRRPCDCDGCSHCNIIIGMCNAWASKKCLLCNEYRCDGCIDDAFKCIKDEPCT